jgi:hypothetical protein
MVVVHTLWMPSINLLKPTDDNSSSSRRVLAFHWVTQTCSKEDLSLHFIACDGTKLAVVLEDGMAEGQYRQNQTKLPNFKYRLYISETHL